MVTALDYPQHHDNSDVRSKHELPREKHLRISDTTKPCGNPCWRDDATMR
jgi:hypothetical protein